MKKTFKTFFAPAVRGLGGAARRAAMTLLAVMLASMTAFANFGWYDGSITIGGVTTNFITGWSTNGNNPTDLGNLTDMTVTSVAFNVWSDSNDRDGANMIFRIWDGGSTQVGSDQDLWLGAATRIQGDHDFAISWTGTWDLASAVGLTLEAGKTYYIDMWAKTYGVSGDQWYNGEGDNYHAKLKYAPLRTVTFNSNDGSAVTAQDVQYGLKATEPTAPTREGCTFAGWTLNGADYDFDSEVTTDITLVAKWSATTTYVDENGTTHDNITATVLGGSETSLAAGTYLVNSNITYTSTITLTGDVTIILGDGKTMTVNTSGIGIGGARNSKDLTIYGQTTQGGTLSVTAGGEGIFCNNITINSGTVNATTNRWNTITAKKLVSINGGVVTATKTDNVQFAIEGYEGVIINGGQLTAAGYGNIYAGFGSITFGYRNATDFISFKSLVVDEALVKIDENKVMTDGTNTYYEDTESATLNALTNKTLRPVTYTVTFDINYDEGTNPEAQTVAHSMKATEPTVDARTGYTFSGWKNGEDDYDFSAAVTTDLNLTAAWTLITYTVQFDKNNNDATGTMDPVVATYDQWTSIPACTFTAPEGKALKEYGWNTEADGSGDSYRVDGDFRNLASEQGATVTLYAQWGKDIALCTADVPDPIYHPNSYHGYFYSGDWNDNHGGIKVYDGETLLTYGTDYQFTMMESLDDKSCEELDEHCRVYLQGLGAYAGILYKDVVIAPATVTNAKWGSLTWNLDADGNFTITGTGAMKAADNYYSYPWYNYGSYFTSITIGTDITTVAAAAFGGDNNTNNYGGVTSISLPTTLTEIGENAFAYCTGATFNVDNLLARGVTIDEDALNQVGCIVGTLQDNGDNSNMLSLMANAATAKVTITGRTLYKDGNWNTICLPFDVKSDNTLLTDATVKELDLFGYYDAEGNYYPYYDTNFTRTGFDAENGALYLFFKDATADSDNNLLKAGTPYLIKWPSGTDITSDLTFDGVKVFYSPQTLTSEDKNVSFNGTFSPETFTSEDKSVLFLGVNNQNQSTLYYPDGSAPTSINAFRAYFQLTGGQHARAFVLNFGEGEETTGVVDVRCKMEDVRSDGWYDLSGRKLDGVPTQKGLYIYNGKKTVIK